MKQLIFLMLVTPVFLAGQELKLLKATKQTVNAGASPTSITNYTVEIKKEKAGKWSIDSVVNVYTQKSVEFRVMKTSDPLVIFPNDEPVKFYQKKDKGTYRIMFASMKNRGSGRPGSPQNLMVPVADFTQGAIIFYTMGKKKKQLLVESFEELETINAP